MLWPVAYSVSALISLFRNIQTPKALDMPYVLVPIYCYSRFFMVIGGLLALRSGRWFGKRFAQVEILAALAVTLSEHPVERAVD